MQDGKPPDAATLEQDLGGGGRLDVLTVDAPCLPHPAASQALVPSAIASARRAQHRAACSRLRRPAVVALSLSTVALRRQPPCEDAYMECSVRLTIPVNSFPVYIYQGIIFQFWLPDETHAIPFADGDLALEGRIWFDPECSHLKPSPHDGRFHVGVPVHIFRMEIILKDVPDDLWPVLTGQQQARPGDGLHERHCEIERRLHKGAVTYANRLISMCRINFGQFWLEEHPSSADVADIVLNSFSPKLLVNGEWRPWHRAGGSNIFRMGTSGGTGAIPEQLWPMVAKYVKEGPRPKLELELLSGADLLAKLGKQRSALVEAATALEVSISRFVKAFDRDAGVRSRLQGVFPDDGGNLAKKVERLGVTHTLRLLLPLLLPTEAVSRERLAVAAAAMDERNRIVHDGKRHVSAEDVQRYLTEVRALCGTLASLGSGDSRQG